MARPALSLPAGSAVATGGKAGGVAVATVLAAGAPAALKLTADRDPICASRDDLAYVTVEVLEKKVPITETTTAAELIEALTAIGLEHEINEQLASTSGSRAGVDSAAVDDRDDTAPTAPASAPVAKVSAAELLEEAGLAHLTEAALGDWAECKRVAAEGRQALLTFLKANGVSKLPERQKLASALAKAHRDERL